MLCPRCSVIFDKKMAQNLEGVRRVKNQGFQRAPKDPQAFQPIRDFDPRRYYDPKRAMMKLDETKRRGPTAKPISFKPNAEASNGKWVKLVDGRKHDRGKWQNFEVDRGSSLTYRKEFQDDRKTSHISKNYKGKNPMTRSQWIREQRRRKAQREVGEKEKVESSTNVPARKKEDLSLDKGKFNAPAKADKEKYDRMAVEDKMLTDDFDSSS